MKWLHIAAVCVLSVAVLIAQQIPSGTALPVMLNSALDAKKDKPGRKVSARVMQDVQLPDGARIPAGSHIVGHVLSVNAATAASPSRLVVKFDQLNSRRRSVPLTTSLRAVASMTEIFEAQLPTSNFDEYGTPLPTGPRCRWGRRGVSR